MRVILHKDFDCAPDGHTTIRYKAGDELYGRAALMAMNAGAGFNPVEEAKVSDPVETKAPRKTGKRK